MARPVAAAKNVSAEISRNLALELVRVTEAGALASARSASSRVRHTHSQSSA